MRVPVSISNRHTHLSAKDIESLFWKEYVCKVAKQLSQPGEVAYEETVTIKWPKGEIKNVRVLWPARKQTQVEIMMGDNYTLWTNAPILLSGDLEKSEAITIIWPKGSIYLPKGLIVAKRHLHVSQVQADDIGVKQNQNIAVKIINNERWLTFENVIVRIKDTFDLDVHIDIEEGNAAGIGKWARWEIIL